MMLVLVIVVVVALNQMEMAGLKLMVVALVWWHQHESMTRNAGKRIAAGKGNKTRIQKKKTNSSHWRSKRY